MATQFREGSMGASEQKSTRNFMVGAGVILLIFALLLYFNVGNTFLGRLQNNGGTGLAFLSLIPFAAACYILWTGYQTGDLGKNPTFKIIAVLLLIILTACIACGFNFDLAQLDR